MNSALLNIPASRQDAALGANDPCVTQMPGSRTVCIQELVHDLRQPLSVIESVAYYLELTSTDEKISAQARKIQAMLFEANRILERAAS